MKTQTVSIFMGIKCCGRDFGRPDKLYLYSIDFENVDKELVFGHTIENRPNKVAHRVMIIGYG